MVHRIVKTLLLKSMLLFEIVTLHVLFAPEMTIPKLITEGSIGIDPEPVKDINKSF